MVKLQVQSITPALTCRAHVDALRPLLRESPVLRIEATNAERRAVVPELVSHVYVQRNVDMAIRPTKIAAASNKAAATNHRDEWLRFVRKWAGWAPGPRSDTLYTLLHPRRVAA